MQNQHQHIIGYRELTQAEIDAMNVIKAEGANLSTLVDQIRNTPDTDKRWVAIAATHFQEGLMALTRAVAKPTSF